MARSVDVYLEVGGKRVFAGALEWPGWCRAGKTEAEALETLAAYRDRYRAMVEQADRPDLPSAAGSFDVAERLTGNATTDFGAPNIPPSADKASIGGTDLDQWIALLKA